MMVFYELTTASPVNSFASHSSCNNFFLVLRVNKFSYHHTFQIELLK